MSRRRLPPTLPGEILLEEFLETLKISQYQLAKEISVPRRRINEIIQGKRALTADTAVRLARYFGISERFWLNLQARYDIEMTKDRLGNRLEREVQVKPRYFPPKLWFRGRQPFVQLPDGRIERITPESAVREEVAGTLVDWFEAQGKTEEFVRYLASRPEGRAALEEVLEKEERTLRKRSRKGSTSRASPHGRLGKLLGHRAT